MTSRGPIQPQLSYGSVKIQQHAIPLPHTQVSDESGRYCHKGSGCVLSPSAWGSHGYEMCYGLALPHGQETSFVQSEVTLCQR